MNRIFLFAVLSCLSLIFMPTSVSAQNMLYIQDIKLEGNSNTRRHIILKEIPFAIGDSVLTTELNEELSVAEERLLFTYLFSEVQINLTDLNQINENLFGTTITINVTEKGFYGLAPILELADRNINVWLFDQNHSLERINVGVKFVNRNLTQRKDILKVKAQVGYTQKGEIQYTLPGISTLPDWGITASALYSRSKEVRINTIANKEVFFSDFDQFHFHRMRFSAGLIYRPSIYQKVSISSGYQRYNLSDTAATINPDFFGNGKTKQKFMNIRVKWEGDYRDRLFVPRKGHRFHLQVEKKGLSSRADLNTYEVEALFGKYFSFSNFILSTEIKGKMAITNHSIPYYNRAALGYEDDFISGFGYYLIDGKSYVYMKNALRHHAFNWNFNLGKYMLIKSLREVRLQTYVSFHYDIGYTDNLGFREKNPLNNEFVYGYGPAIDVIYNETIKASALFGINKKNEVGFYFRITSAF